MITKIILFFMLCFAKSNKNAMCSEYSEIPDEYRIRNVTVNMLEQITRDIVPQLQYGKAKGESGRIGIVGGSPEYIGGTYFAAISALRSGAALVHVVTTESAAPVMRSYIPDFAVFSYLSYKSASKISSIIRKLDVVVIGPGLAEDDEAITQAYNVINTCKTLGKPIVIDAHGIFAVAKYPTILKNYPGPGVIMTPNQYEAKILKEALAGNGTGDWFSFWGDNVSILVKGRTDQFHSSNSSYSWSSSQGGSGRRTAGQGDMLSGFLGSIFGWAIKYNNYGNYRHECIAQSVATYASAKLTRLCNSKAFKLYGRSMTASDMIGQIHNAFEEIF